jgi:hypothetical protein
LGDLISPISAKIKVVLMHSPIAGAKGGSKSRRKDAMRDHGNPIR